MFCSSIDNIKAFEERCIKYCMMNALMILGYHDRVEENTSNKWGGSEISKFLLDHWSLFALDHIVYFLHGIVQYCESDEVSSEWVREFDYGYSTEELCDWFNETYSTTEIKEQGRITMVKLNLESILFISNDVVTILQFFLKDFGRNDLAAVARKNVAVVVH